jgi:threonine/homoserine/homoserine lactone efflux protein
MTLQLYAAFVLAVTVLMLIPGPNVALIAANSTRYGPRLGLVTVAGVCAAMVVQLALVGLGLAGALKLAGRTFEMVRWAGVAWLVWLGLRAWFEPPENLAAVRPKDGRPCALFAGGFVVSLTNPKTLLFYAALLPQFVSGADPGRQIWILAATSLCIAMVLDSGWALLAARLGPRLTRRGRLRSRLTGAVLIAAGAGLAAARGGR